jgi:hypothetical protein
MLLLSFVSSKIHLAKLLQKIVASQKNHRITSHVATLFCNHLVKLLQKIVASPKTQHIGASVASKDCAISRTAT